MGSPLLERIVRRIKQNIFGEFHKASKQKNLTRQKLRKFISVAATALFVVCIDRLLNTRLDKNQKNTSRNYGLFLK